MPVEKSHPRAHAELIKLWADGAKIQREQTDGSWKTESRPTWKPEYNYRLVPRKLEVGKFYPVSFDGGVKLVLEAVTTSALVDAENTYTVDECYFIGEAIEPKFEQ